MGGQATAHAFAWRQIWGQRDELFRLLRVLKNRRGLIFGLAAVVTLAAVVAVYKIPPRYSAAAKLLIDPKSGQFMQPEMQILPGLMVDREAIESEMQILSSRRMAATVAETLDLAGDPEFNPRIAEQSPLAFLTVPLDRVRAGLRDVLGGETPPAGDPAELEQREVVDRLIKKREVYREGQSRVIAIRVTTRSPAKSAQIANAFAETYLVDHLDNQFAQRKRIATWLDDRLEEFKFKAQASQKAVEDYRREAGLFETRDEGGRTERIDTQQLTQISAQLIGARADVAALEAKLRTLERATGAGGAYESVPEVIANPVIGTLRTQEARALQRAADLETTYGPRHPSMVAARSELEDIRRNIRNEIQRVVASVRNEVTRARAREAALEQSYRQFEAKTAQQNTRQIRLSELNRESDVNQRVLSQFLEQFQGVTARQALQQPEARVIAPAEAPLLASYPRKAPTVALAFLGSLLLGCALALLLDRMNSTFRTEDEVEEATGLPTLAVVPAIPGPGLWDRHGHLVAGRSPGSLPSGMTEAVHTLGVALISRGLGGQKNRVLFTSAFPGEGKSVVALGFARNLARQGRRVILVDADFRRPQLSRVLGLVDAPGLQQVLLGEAKQQEVVHECPDLQLRVVPAGQNRGGSADHLEQGALDDLMRRLSLEADCVVVDAAPALVVPDALTLARATDHTLLVVRWNRTTREDVSRLIKQLETVGRAPTGIVLNAVDIGRYAGYAYRDSRTYLRAYASYYR